MRMLVWARAMLHSVDGKKTQKMCKNGLERLINIYFNNNKRSDGVIVLKSSAFIVPRLLFLMRFLTFLKTIFFIARRSCTWRILKKTLFECYKNAHHLAQLLMLIINSKFYFEFDCIEKRKNTTFKILLTKSYFYYFDL